MNQTRGVQALDRIADVVLVSVAAQRAGITVTALGRVERGRVNPGWTTLRSILTGLDASLTDLEAAIEHAKRRSAE